MKFCEFCGVQINDTAVFCEKCGKPCTVSVNEARPARPVQPVQYIPQVAAPVLKKRSKMPLIISLVLVGLAGVAAAVIFLILPMFNGVKASPVSDFEYLKYHDGYGNSYIGIDRYIGNDKDVVIPSRIEGLPVTVIYNSAFNMCENLESLIIPESVRTLSIASISNCYKLKKVSVPDGATAPNGGVFLGCINLECLTYKGKTYNYDDVISGEVGRVLSGR